MSFYMGPEFTFLTKAHVKYDDANIEQAAKTDFEALGFGSYRDIYRKNMITFVLGFGPNFSITDYLKINSTFRFSIGLSDAENKSATTSSGLNYWDTYGIGGDNRESALNFTGGFNLGISYILEL